MIEKVTSEKNRQTTTFEVTSRDDEKLKGVRSVPNEIDSKLPVILFVHGFSSNADSSTLCSIDERLNDRYITYRFSFSGRGESEGQYVDMTLSKEVSELKSVLDYIKSQENATKIVVFAHSFGTNSTIALNPKVDLIILAAPFDNPIEFYEKRYAENLHKDGISCWKKTSTGETVCLGSGFWSDLEKYKLDELAQDITSPVLIVHGLSDTTIFPNQSERIFKNLKVKKQRVLIPNADHKFRQNIDGLYAAAYAWIEKI